jgi:hypothetical protein
MGEGGMGIVSTFPQEAPSFGNLGLRHSVIVDGRLRTW